MLNVGLLLDMLELLPHRHLLAHLLVHALLGLLLVAHSHHRLCLSHSHDRLCLGHRLLRFRAGVVWILTHIVRLYECL